MPYVVVANWHAREGEQDGVAQAIAEVTPLVHAEPGCLMYVAHRSTEDPLSFMLYEQYVDEAAFTAHTQTEHFQRLVLGEAVPRLDQRSVTRYVTID